MNDSFIEMDACQMTKDGMRICGDVFLMERHAASGRIVATLSDGMGSGVKANVLATLTAGMGQRFVLSDADVKKSAEVILNTLPVCRERKISYATFTLADIRTDGTVNLIEYDNPPTLWIRDGAVRKIERTKEHLNRKDAFRPEVLRSAACTLLPEDRLVFCSDGVVQSGMGTAAHPLGWRMEGFERFLEELVRGNPEISAGDMALRVVRRAMANDGYRARDDISCVVAYVRRPRKLLLATGPPFERDWDTQLAGRLAGFKGRKVICGGTTASIVAREWNRPLHVNLKNRTDEVPPSANLEGVDLVTEGMLTLGKTAEILESHKTVSPEETNAAEHLAALLRESDEVSFLVGTRINEAHHNPTLPIELGIRRTLIERIRRSLETLYLKKTDVMYV